MIILLVELIFLLVFVAFEVNDGADAAKAENNNTDDNPEKNSAVWNQEL